MLRNAPKTLLARITGQDGEWTIPFGASCGAIVLLLLLWPGDVPWGGDDVILISHAMTANREHRLIDAGLTGSFSLPYGPVPEQIYQGLLWLTHNPLLIVRLHSGIMAATTAAALLWLTRTMKWSPWLGAMGMLSPYYWHYSRLLWDNTFAIPAGAMLLAAYAAYVRRRTMAPFLTAMGCALTLLLIHPMSIPLVAAVTAHAIPRRREPLRRWWPGIVVLLLCSAVSGGRYLLHIADRHTYGPVRATLWYEHMQLGHIHSAAFPLSAGQLFSAYSFFDPSLGPAPGGGGTIRTVAGLISAAAYPLAWIGMVFCLTRLRADWISTDAAAAVRAISIVTLILQGIFYGLLGVAPFPHYFCGIWIACWVCLCMGVIRLGRVGVVAGAIYAGSLVAATAVIWLSVHRDGGGRGWYGLSLGTQLSAAGKLSGFGDLQAQSDVPQLGANPQSLAVLRQMLAQPVARYSHGHLLVRWLNPDSTDLKLDVVELPGPLPGDALDLIPTGVEHQ